MAQSLIKTAKALRKRSTDVERLLWRYLRAKQIGGLKFRRQQPIGQYIVDFACFEKKIVIEVDGGQHAVERRIRKEMNGSEARDSRCSDFGIMRC